MKPCHIVAVALALACPAAAQTWSNDVPLNNQGDVVYLYSSPSVGAPVGTVPPDASGDLYWTVLPGDGVLRHATALGAVVEIDGYYESLFDTDWSTSPAFYDRSHGAALSGAGGALEPAFFQLGWTSEVVVSIGPSGFGLPCTIAPSFCDPSGGTCPPAGYVNGYLVDLRFGSTPGSGVYVAADGTPASDHAVTWFVHGGMTATGGTCGLGDYVLQDVHSTDETLVPLPDGSSPFGGFQLAGSGPVAEAATSAVESNLTFRAPMLNVLADTGGGLGVEVGDNGGGGRNALRLSVGSDAATLGVELRSHAHGGVPNLAVVGASFETLPSPGVDLLGARLLLKPTSLLWATAAAWTGAVSPTTFVFTSESAFVGAQLPVPATAAGASLALQGFVLDLGTGIAANTNVWRTSFHP